MIEKFSDSFRFLISPFFALTVYFILVLSYGVLSFDPILNAFFIHSVLAFFIVVCWFLNSRAFKSTTPSWIQGFRLYFSTKNRLFFVFPSVLVVSVSALAAFVSNDSTIIDLKVLVNRRFFLLTTFVPLIEEILFRLGLSSIFRKLSGFYVGTYLSICLFAFLHPNPLGPALLSICCELLFLLSGRLWPAVVFHGACNLTVYIFYLVDPRWLEWLAIFYQGS